MGVRRYIYENSTPIEQAGFLWKVVYEEGAKDTALESGKRRLNICSQFNINREHLNKILRTFDVLRSDETLLAFAKKEKIPLRTLISASSVAVNTTSTRAALAVLQRYVESQKELRAHGRSRNLRRDAGPETRVRYADMKTEKIGGCSRRLIGKDSCGLPVVFDNLCEIHLQCEVDVLKQRILEKKIEIKTAETRIRFLERRGR